MRIPKLSADPNANWANNDIQFPRLLAEINAAGLTSSQYKDICDSMDLTIGDINEILDRAEETWRLIKEST